MFKLQRSFRRSSKSKDNFDFAFSDFKLLQVPKGWEKLFLSLVSVETGKSVAKLDSALVKSGSCQWKQTLSHSVYISRDDSSISKGYEQSLVKLLVSSGKSRNSTLGEVTINLADWTGSSVASEISLPLKRCSYGTVLEMKIECLTPRLKLSLEESEFSSFREPSLDFGSESTERKSNVSDYASPLKSDFEEETQSQHASIQALDSLDGEDLSIMSTLETEECLSSIENDSPLNEQSLNPGMLFHSCVIASPRLATGDLMEDTAKQLGTEAQMSKKITSKMMNNVGGNAFENAMEDMSKSTVKSSDDSLLLQLQQLKDSEKRLKADIRLLKETLSQKNGNNREKSETAGYVECETSEEVDSEVPAKELQLLRDKVQELESDCEELTSENLQLLFKINELTKRRDRECSIDSNPSDDSQVSDPKCPIDGDTNRENNEEKASSPESLKCFPQILRQIHMAFRLLGKPRIQSCDEIDLGSGNVSADYVLSLLQEMNELLKMRNSEAVEKTRTISDMIEEMDHKTTGSSLVQESDVIKSIDLSLQDKITELQLETEVQILTLKQAVEDIHKHWLVTQEENQILKEEIKVLKSHAASSGKETTNLGRLNLELHEKCSSLAAQLYESREFLSDNAQKVMSLDDYLSSVVEYFSQREQVLSSSVRDILQENSHWIQKLAMLESTHQELMQKTRDLEKEVELLNSQLIYAHNEKERISFEACSEVSLLLADKAQLQAALEESQARAAISEKKLNQKLQESELKVEGLMIQVTASMQSHARLMIDNEKSFKLLASYKKSEEKMKCRINELESKLQLTKDKRGCGLNAGRPVASNVDDMSRKQLLENEMDSTRESESRGMKNNHSVSSWNLSTVKVSNKFERTKSSLEAELKDLRERYLEMSLKYAEVEAQREDLVMKLKQARLNK